MKMPASLAALLVTGVLTIGTAIAGESGTALKAADIMAEPFRDAETVGSLRRGDMVEILEKRGGWYRVKSAAGRGWVRMLGIRRGTARKARVDAGGLLGLASGRAGTGRVVATTGIRGLDEEDLAAAKYNETELKTVESFTVTAAEARKFAAEGKLRAREVEYPSPPGTAQGARPW